jgi:hypothetical protein
MNISFDPYITRVGKPTTVIHKVGDGRLTSFWDDVRLEPSPLHVNGLG